MPLALNEVSKSEVDAALERLQASPLFDRSPGLLRLLRFLLQAAEEAGEPLRESYIATAFFKRDDTYDPRVDAIVRVNLRRLRQRLDEFYAAEGADEAIRFSVPVGSYVPAIDRMGGGVAASAVDVPHVESSLPEQEVAAPVAVGEAAAAANVGAEPERRAPRRSGVRLLWAVAVLLLLGGAVLVAVLLWLRSTARPALVLGRFDEVPLTAGQDLEFEPATSADGKWLAYVSRAGGAKHFQIFVRALGAESRGERVIEAGPENALYPAWSPDGRQLAFLRCGTGPCEIATVPVAGGAVRSVRTLPTYSLPDDQAYYQYRQLDPAWTQDGRALIYPYRGVADTAERLVEHDLSTGQMRDLTSGQAGDEDAAPSVAPDGRELAFLRRHLDRTEVRTLDLQTGGERVLETEPNATTTGVTWAPDGRGVVIGSARRRGYVLLYIPLRGQPAVIDVKRQIPMNPMFARGSNMLMYVAANRTRNLSVVRGADDAAPLFPSKQRNTFTALSSDGGTLAFLSDRSGGFEVWLSRRSGKEFLLPRQLTHGIGWYPSSIAWAPDGRTLAVGISNSNEVDLVSAETGNVSPLRLPGLEHCDVWSPAWSADGRWIYLSAWGEKDGIFRASTGAVPAVEQIWSGRAREIRLDGDRALYFGPNYGTGIYRLPLAGGGQPEAVPQLAGVQASRAWLVQDGMLLYMDVHEPVTRLHALQLAGGTVTKVTGPLTRVAFADGTISYLAAERMLVYSEWSADAGSQIFGLRWR